MVGVVVVVVVILCALPLCGVGGWGVVGSYDMAFGRQVSTDSVRLYKYIEVSPLGGFKGSGLYGPICCVTCPKRFKNVGKCKSFRFSVLLLFLYNNI